MPKPFFLNNISLNTFMRTRVCITIDTEFSIAGAFAHASKRPVAEQNVWCNVNGRSEGLGFMLETFRKNAVTATFFVETVQRYYFKDDPMAPIAKRIHDEGHEVQLHTHPCWSHFQHEDWRERLGGKRGNDDFKGRSVADSVQLIEQGISSFRDWGLPRPTVFRSGNLQHDDNLYQALARAGIPYSSNVAVAIYDSGDASFKLYSGQHERHGVTEFPVLTFSDWALGPKQHIRSLTIAGSSFTETRALLEQARDAGIALVVLLTHPFEYVQTHDMAFKNSRRYGLTQSRLTQLCEFLHENSDRFDACGLGQAATAMPAAGTPPANTLLKGSLWRALPRMAAQVATHKVGHWMLDRTHGRRG
jgi:peptidoglycan/xylan/chitin deacetylase (PgdA/CDA1 family)